MSDEVVDVGVGSRLLGAAGRVTVGNVVSRALSLATGIAAARILSEVEFGGFGAVQGAVSMGATLASFALGLAATRYVAKYRNERPDEADDVARIVFVFSAVSVSAAALILLMSASWLAHSVFAEPFLVNPLRVSALYLIGTVIQGVGSGVLLGYERFTAAAVVAVVQNVVIFIGVLTLAPYMRLTGTILVHAAGVGAGVLVTLWVTRNLLVGVRWTSLRRGVSLHGSEIARFCMPHTLAAVLIAPAGWTATVLLARSEPAGLAELGFFTAAQRFYLLILFVSGFLGSVLLPILSSLTAGSDDSRRALEYGLIGTGLLVVPLSVFIVFGGPVLMRIFGDAYASHWTVLLPMAAWASAEAVGAAIGFSLIARGHQWFTFVQQVGYATTLVALAFLFRPWGAPGLACAHLGAIGAVIGGSLLSVRRRLELSPRALVAYLSAGAIPLGFGALSLVLENGIRWVVAAVAVAGSAAFYLWLLDASERAGLAAAVRRVRRNA